jgi:hypothetical protein
MVNNKYGVLPKWAQFGELTACNLGEHNITFGQGDVIAALRTAPGRNSLQAFSIQDAFSLVGNAQAASKKNVVEGWIRAGAESAVESKAAGLIGGGGGTGMAIVVGAELLKIIIPNVDRVLSLKQVIQYSQDGMQKTMAVSAGRCTDPMSVLFAVPAGAPSQGTAPPISFPMNVPMDK